METVKKSPVITIKIALYLIKLKGNIKIICSRIYEEIEISM